MTEHVGLELENATTDSLAENSVETVETVDVEGLTKHYGRIEAIRDVSLRVKRGEIFGLLGANGAGKTTLIRTLVGSSLATAGTVSVLGMNPANEAHKLRRQVGYMPQKPALYEDLSAWDNVRFFAQAHRLSNLEARVRAVLTFTELWERRHDLVHTFSGGMKQRVSLACALVHRPPVLLLDEPSAGVDPKLREAFWRHFHFLAGEGVTILLSTHQMDEAIHCDRVAVMRHGVILICDAPAKLLSRGRAQVSVWCDGQVRHQTISNYPEELPQLLQAYNLTPAVSRIEIQASTLEDIVLDLIGQQSAPSPAAPEGAQ
jgi:ABC-2 type transport system ATP-binding protein